MTLRFWRSLNWLPALLMSGPAVFLAGSTTPDAAAHPAPLRRFYSLTQIQPLPGYPHTTAVAMNEAGQVVCRADNPASGAARAFLWSNGLPTEIPAPTGGSTIPYALDDLGGVAGAEVMGDGSRRPFTWRAGVFTPLLVPVEFVGAEARAVAGNDTVAGDLIDASGGHHACLWAGDGVTILPSLPGRPYSQVRGMNDAGQVAGASFTHSDPAAGFGRATLWTPFQAVDLGVLTGYSTSEANAINNQGEVVGTCVEPPGFQRAFRWRSGVMSALGGSYAGDHRSTSAYAIDNSGRVAGQSGEWLEFDGYWKAPQAGEWRNDAFDTFPVPPTPLGRNTLTTAVARNESDQLAVNGSDWATLAERYAFFLAPAHATLEANATAVPETLSVGEVTTLTATFTNLGPETAYEINANTSNYGGLEFLEVKANRGVVQFNPAELPGWANIRADRLDIGDQLVISIRARVHAGGELRPSIQAMITNGPDVLPTASFRLSVPGTALPDLAGRWGSLHFTEWEQTAGGERCWALIDLYTHNLGTADASSCPVRIYVLEERHGRTRKRLFRRSRSLYFQPGDARLIRLRWPVRHGLPPPHLRLLAEIDPRNEIRESLEENNHALLETDLKP